MDHKEIYLPITNVFRREVSNCDWRVEQIPGVL